MNKSFWKLIVGKTLILERRTKKRTVCQPSRPHVSETREIAFQSLKLVKGYLLKKNADLGVLTLAPFAWKKSRSRENSAAAPRYFEVFIFVFFFLTRNAARARTSFDVVESASAIFFGSRKLYIFSFFHFFFKHRSLACARRCAADLSL